MAIFSRLVLAAMLLAARPLLAQQQPYTYSLTEPDQELDGFRGGYAKIHKISTQLRGVRGADSTLYWVSSDGRQLTAYRRGRQLWQADISQAFARILPNVKIATLVLSSNIIFVFTAQNGHAEIARATGKVAAMGVDTE